MSLQRIVPIGVVLVALLASASGPASSDESGSAATALPVSPQLLIERDPAGISVTGAVSSDAHEAILRDVAGRHVPSSDIVFDVQRAELLPPGWALVTELTLRAMLTTRFSEAKVNAGGVSIRGVTADAAAWHDARSRLDASLLSGMQLETNVIEVPSMPDYLALCRRQFDALLKNRKLEFAIAGSSLESGAEALLDGLVEAAADCPDAVLSIRAGGDGPASVTGNRELAEARLQAIVDYLAVHGLPETRIESLAVADGTAGNSRKVTFTVSFAKSGIDTGAADAGR